jgi:hypothetical protein
LFYPYQVAVIVSVSRLSVLRDAIVQKCAPFYRGIPAKRMKTIIQFDDAPELLRKNIE